MYRRIKRKEKEIFLKRKHCYSLLGRVLYTITVNSHLDEAEVDIFN